MAEKFNHFFNLLNAVAAIITISGPLCALFIWFSKGKRNIEDLIKQTNEERQDYKEKNWVLKFRMKFHLKKICQSNKINLEKRRIAISLLPLFDEMDLLTNILNNKNEDSKIRTSAAYSLSQIGSIYAIQKLCDNLMDDDPFVVANISFLLSEQISPNVINSLNRAFVKHRDNHNVVETILNSLDKIFENAKYYGTTLDIMKNFLSENHAPKLSEKAVDVIVKIESEKTLNILNSVLKHFPLTENEDLEKSEKYEFKARSQINKKINEGIYKIEKKLLCKGNINDAN